MANASLNAQRPMPPSTHWHDVLELQRHQALVDMRAAWRLIGQSHPKAPLHLFDAFEPTWPCPDMTKVPDAAFHEHRWVCGMLAARRIGRVGDCLIYSFVTKGDHLLWEQDMHRRLPLCEVHVFDSSNRSNEAVARWGGSFHPIGLPTSLEEVMAALGHAGQRIQVLKVDIGGAEWHVHSLGRICREQAGCGRHAV